MRTVITLGVAVAAVSLAPRGAAAEPAISRVLTAPTAWLPDAGAVVGMIGGDRHGGSLVIGYGLGGIAEVELGADTDVRACAPCDKSPEPLLLGRAGFRIGAHQNQWFAGMPAIVFGVRTTFAAHGHDVHEPRTTDAYLVASRELGTLARVHAGAEAISASVNDVRMPAQVRPLLGLELRPPQFPKTTMLGDFSYEPRLSVPPVASPGPTPEPTPEWLVGVGVRYQALTWASIDLAVEHRENDDLGASRVVVRINGILSR